METQMENRRARLFQALREDNPDAEPAIEKPVGRRLKPVTQMQMNTFRDLANSSLKRRR